MRITARMPMKHEHFTYSLFRYYG